MRRPSCRRQPHRRGDERGEGRQFEVGDHVRWNSEAGHVSGRITTVHTRDFDYKGHTHHARDDDPPYEIKSDKTAHVAAYKGRVLHTIDSLASASTGEQQPRQRQE